MSRELIGRTALDVGAVIIEMQATGNDLETIFATLTKPQARAQASRT